MCIILFGHRAVVTQPTIGSDEVSRFQFPYRSGGGEGGRGCVRERRLVACPFFPTIFDGTLLCLRYTMVLPSKVANMFGGARKRPLSINDDGSGELSKSPRRDGVYRARASGVSEMDLGNISVSRWDAAEPDDHSGVRLGVSPYTGADCRCPATQSGRIAREVSLERFILFGGCDWDDLDVMDYVCQSEHLDSRHFGVFLVDGRSSRNDVDGNSWVTVYGACKKWM